MCKFPGIGWDKLDREEAVFNLPVDVLLLGIS